MLTASLLFHPCLKTSPEKIFQHHFQSSGDYKLIHLIKYDVAHQELNKREILKVLKFNFDKSVVLPLPELCIDM
jgi:hypothetical protein